MRTILVVFFSCIMMFGCAHSPMKFRLAPGTTQNDFKQAKIDCGEDTGGGGFIFGPAIVVVGVVATVESIRFAKKNKFQDCMEAKGFKCIMNCPHESTVIVAPVDPQIMNKWTQTIRTDQKREWVLYAKSPKGAFLYYDPSSLSVEDQRYLVVREQVQFPPERKENFSAVWRTSKVNCRDNIFKFSDFTALDCVGNTVDPGIRETGWRNLSEGYTIGSFIYKKCEEVIALGTKGSAQVQSLKQNMAENDKAPMVTLIETKKDSRFIDNRDGTVTDTKTGLMWAARDNGRDIKWADAKSYCDNYRGGGHTDWRMPTPNEIGWLYDRSRIRRTSCDQSSTIYVTTDLIDITCYYHWSSETGTRFGLLPNAVYVNFDDGSRDWVRQSYSSYYRVIPVRSIK